MHRAEGTLNGIPHPAYGLVHGRLAPCQRLVLLCLVHDAAFEPHAGERAAVFGRIIALVRQYRRALCRVRLSQRRFKVPYVTFVGRRGLLGYDGPVLVDDRVAFVAEMALAGFIPSALSDDAGEASPSLRLSG